MNTCGTSQPTECTQKPDRKSGFSAQNQNLRGEDVTKGHWIGDHKTLTEPALQVKANGSPEYFTSDDLPFYPALAGPPQNTVLRSEHCMTLSEHGGWTRWHSHGHLRAGNLKSGCSCWTCGSLTAAQEISRRDPNQASNQSRRQQKVHKHLQTSTFPPMFK